ncbi:MAG: succinate dehydrogenase cytochrome b subunit [Saprospiraceae bacterium]|nr:succinate dehydrogenase cytochrome b subunit [Saprospiraceae bacterium]
MKWLIDFFGSGIGKKLLMSLTGLFLIIFLLVHLIGNLQLLKDDSGMAFNLYAKFMKSNPLIKTVSYGLYFFIILHAIIGVMLALYNMSAKGGRYAVANHNKTSWASKNMVWLGSIIFAFILIHMGDFWFKMKSGQLPLATYGDVTVNDLYYRVAEAFQNPFIVIGYVIGMVILGMHLWHGFQSAFQTLGLNHKKYTPMIKAVGKVYSILVTIGFIIIPVYHFMAH